MLSTWDPLCAFWSARDTCDWNSGTNALYEWFLPFQCTTMQNGIWTDLEETFKMVWISRHNDCYTSYKQFWAMIMVLYWFAPAMKKENKLFGMFSHWNIIIGIIDWRMVGMHSSVSPFFALLPSTFWPDFHPPKYTHSCWCLNLRPLLKTRVRFLPTGRHAK